MKNYPLNSVDYYSNFHEAIKGMSAKYAEKIAISEYSAQGQEKTYTYTKLYCDVEAFSQWLKAHGYSGKHIAVISENSYYYIVAVFAVTSIGATVVTIDIEQSEEVISHMVKFADCDAFFASTEMLEVIQQKKLFSDMEYVVLDEKESDTRCVAYCIKEGRELINNAAIQKEDIDYQKNPAFIIFTSGTTSRPKAVMLSQYSVLLNASDSLALVKMPDKIFTSLPFYHIYGLNIGMINHLIAGAHLCVNGNIKHMQRDLLAFEPEAIMAVPIIVEMILKTITSSIVRSELSQSKKNKLLALAENGPYNCPALIEIKSRIFPKLHRILCGGAYLPEKTTEMAMRFGIELLQGYGMTECAPLIAGNRPDYFSVSAVGVALAHYEIKLVDDEILVRGDALMTGYYKDEKETEMSFCEGWFKTGDLGSIDGNGFLTIIGRKKNLIVLKNGKKISPEELENKLLEVPLIKEAIAYGSFVGNNADDVVPAVTIYPNPALCEHMSSFEILNELQREIDKINDTLPTFKQIKVINISEKEFSKTTGKKIIRNIF